MADLPTGTVTFLFTDLEGSTRVRPAHPAAYRDAVRRHHALLRGAVEASGGVVFETLGDAVHAAFARPGDAGRGPGGASRAPGGRPGGREGPLRARMGVHTGRGGGGRARTTWGDAGALRPPAGHGPRGPDGALQRRCRPLLVRDALPAGRGPAHSAPTGSRTCEARGGVPAARPGTAGNFPPLRTLDALPTTFRAAHQLRRRAKAARGGSPAGAHPGVDPETSRSPSQWQGLSYLASTEGSDPRPFPAWSPVH